jgi:hypothetical protein
VEEIMRNAIVRERESFSSLPAESLDLVFLTVYGAQESIPRNEFRQPM